MDRAALVRQLFTDEDLRLVVYDDATGKPIKAGMLVIGNPTIGVGRNLTGKGISRGEAIVMLDHDLDESEADCLTFPWFAELDDTRQRAVANLRFNLGGSGFRTFRKFISAMARKNYEMAGLELVSSRWAKQVAPSRVSELRKMIEDGD